MNVRIDVWVILTILFLVATVVSLLLDANSEAGVLALCAIASAVLGTKST